MNQTFQNPQGDLPYSYANKVTPAEMMLALPPDSRLDILNVPDVESLVLMSNDVMMQLFHPQPILTDSGETYITGFLGHDLASPLVKIKKEEFSRTIVTYITKTDQEKAKMGQKAVSPGLFPHGVPPNMDQDKVHTALLPIWTVKPTGHEMDPVSIDKINRAAQTFEEMRQSNWL